MKRPAIQFIGIGVSAVGLVVSAWLIVATFRWTEIGQLLVNANLRLLFTGGAASLLFYWLLRALRWQFMLRRMGVRIPFVDVYLCTATTVSFALVTPIQSGEALKVELFRKFGMVGRFVGYGSLFVERALDFLVLLGIGCAGLLSAVAAMPRRQVGCVAFVGLACATLVLVLALKHRFPGKAGEFQAHVRACVRDPATLVGGLTFTCVSWLSVGLSWQIFLYCGGVHLGFLRSLALMAVVALIGIISLIPAGLGITEVSTAAILVQLGQPVSAAQAGALVLRSYTVLALALGAAHFGAWHMLRRYRAHAVVAAGNEPTGV